LHPESANHFRNQRFAVAILGLRKIQPVFDNFARLQEEVNPRRTRALDPAAEDPAAQAMACDQRPSKIAIELSMMSLSASMHSAQRSTAAIDSPPAYAF